MNRSEHDKAVDACAARFKAVATSRSYRHAIRCVRDEFPSEVVEDFETRNRAKVETGQDMMADAKATSAARRWSPLYENTGP